MKKVQILCKASFAGTDMETGEVISGYGGQIISVSPLTADDLIRANYADAIATPPVDVAPTAETEVPASDATPIAPAPTAKGKKKGA